MHHLPVSLEIIAFVLTMFSYGWMIKSVLKNEMPTSIVSWVASISLALLMMICQHSLNGILAAIVSLSQALGVGCAIVAVCINNIRHHGGWLGSTGRFEWSILIASLAIAAFYTQFSAAAMAIVLAVVADGVGMVPTIRDAFRSALPKESSYEMRPWLVDALAGGLGSLAVLIGDGLSFALLVFPVYLIAINLIVPAARCLGVYWYATIHSLLDDSSSPTEASLLA